MLLKGVLFKLEKGLPVLVFLFSCLETFLSVVDNFRLTSRSTDLKLSCFSTPAVGILIVIATLSPALTVSRVKWIGVSWAQIATVLCSGR